MAWIRYIVYFLGAALITWMLTQLELSSPGSLKLHVVVNPDDLYGTSEFSPLEIVQVLILGLCGLLMAWIVRYCPAQRTIAIPFGGVALAFLIRELDYFLDRFVADNFWGVLIAVVAALQITYIYRQRRRMKVAWARVWPSPGIAIIFAGTVVLAGFAVLIGHEPLWQSILGSDYQRIVKLAVEEFIELIGYVLWLIGAIEYAYQARAIAFRKPQPAANRRRQKRRHEAEGDF
jgi:hypothetical protein